MRFNYRTYFAKIFSNRYRWCRTPSWVNLKAYLLTGSVYSTVQIGRINSGRSQGALVPHTGCHPCPDDIYDDVNSTRGAGTGRIWVEFLPCPLPRVGRVEKCPFWRIKKYIYITVKNANRDVNCDLSKPCRELLCQGHLFLKLVVQYE